jgi:hypothetical protein
MMLAMLEHSPDLYLDKVQEQLSVVHGLELCLMTISRTLKWLGMTSKKVRNLHQIRRQLNAKHSQLSKPAAERCEEARRDFAFEVGKYPADYPVTADESAVNLLTTYRLNGWAYEGTQARKACNFVRGTR